ncbi:GMC oxidoreductase [Trametes sanguinea]|nr:GMC oxidoreductase [Trametes sanguinea]
MILQPESFISTCFDYVIVGGGTAGLALATRLSEDPSVVVGVIEAGDWHPNLDRINVPGLCGSLVGDVQYDWAFTSVPQSNLNNRQIHQPRGKGLGGSSMLLVGHAERSLSAAACEYDALEVLGNPGWNWHTILKYMKKSESTVIPPQEHIVKYSLAPFDPCWHGESGPITKSYPTYFNSLHKAFVATLEHLGVPWNPDPCNGCNVGTALNHSTYDARSAIRSYSANAYYEPVCDRKNLLILTGALVSRIVFKSGVTPLVANGVEFIKGQTTYIATCRRDVVLSAGSFQTPKLLELSGLGNKEILSQHDIDTLLHLPGDHLFVTTIHEIDAKYDTLDVVEGPETLPDPEPKASLASPPTALFGFLPAQAFMEDEQRSEWKAIAIATAENAPAGLKKLVDLQIEWFEDPSVAEGEIIPFPGFFRLSGLKPEPNKRYSSMVATSMHPLSRGSTHIASADPTAPPRIDPKYLSNPADLPVLVAALKFALKAYRTEPLGEAVRKQVAPSIEESASDEALAEYVKNTCASTYHPLGTAAMLPIEDGGVVGPDLRVHGTANLRVVSPNDA